MKKSILVIFASAISLLATAQEVCFTIPTTNGLSYQGDSIALGGLVDDSTIVLVNSGFMAIIGADTMGYFLADDNGDYSLFIGNVLTTQGLNVNKDIVNLFAANELNVVSDYYTLKDANDVHYVVYSTGKVDFGTDVNVFLNCQEYASNADAIIGGLPIGALYFNTFTNSYSKVN